MIDEQLKEYSPEILVIRRNLHRIQETGTAPINLTLYKKLGLVETRYKMTRTGHRIFDKLILTQKANNILALRTVVPKDYDVPPSRTELLNFAKNIFDLKPLTPVDELNIFYKVQDDILNGKIKTNQEIRDWKAKSILAREFEELAFSKMKGIEDRSVEELSKVVAYQRSLKSIPINKSKLIVSPRGKIYSRIHHRRRAK